MTGAANGVVRIRDGATGGGGRVRSVAPGDDVMLARAFLSRVAEPACVPLWAAVRELGPVELVNRIRAGSAPPAAQAACASRADTIDPHADLAAADRHGIRLVVPESPDWPHFALSCLESAGRRRLARWQAGERKAAEGGEPVPPLALWVRGPLDLSTLAVRSVGIVGSRAATTYGEQVAADLSYALADHEVEIVSGGAFGIDAAAHRGALAASGRTVLVSAGGLDRPYPASNAALFERAAVEGLLISESAPGGVPRRQRFLTRNRLIAALSTGTVVVEAAARSGARNTANHCVVLGRPLMVVPGPVTSAASAGCHALLVDDRYRAHLVTGWRDVLDVVGRVGEEIAGDGPSGSRPETSARSARDRLQEQLDLLDLLARQVFDGLPARRPVTVDRLAFLSGVSALDVIRVLPVLELAGLAEPCDGQYRVGGLVRAAALQASRGAPGTRPAEGVVGS